MKLAQVKIKKMSQGKCYVTREISCDSLPWSEDTYSVMFNSSEIKMCFPISDAFQLLLTMTWVYCLLKVGHNYSLTISNELCVLLDVNCEKIKFYLIRKSIRNS